MIMQDCSIFVLFLIIIKEVEVRDWAKKVVVKRKSTE